MARRPRASTPERRTGWRRWLAAPFVVLAAVILLVEEWLWDDLARLAATIGRLPPFRWVEPLVLRLPPWAALALFALPSLLLIPVKLAAVWLVAHGHAILGVGVLVGAKIAGTAVLARIYSLTRPQLLSIGWFARLHGRVVAFKERVHDIIHATAIYRATRERALRLRAWARELIGPRDGVSWRRRWAAALRLSRRRARPD